MYLLYLTPRLVSFQVSLRSRQSRVQNQQDPANSRETNGTPRNPYFYPRQHCRLAPLSTHDPRLLPDLPQATASPTPTPHSRYECPWQQHGISGSLYSERRPTSPDDRSWHAKIIGTSAVRFLGGAPRQLSRLRRCPSSFCRGYTKAALPFPYDCHRAHIE